MAKGIVLVVLAIVISQIYLEAVTAIVGYAASFPIPSWWNSQFSSRGSAALTWMVTVHTFAVLVASLPFAFAIERMYGGTGVWVALALTIALHVLMHGWAPFEYFRSDPTRIKVVILFDAIKIIGLLPALVWVFWLLPSNSRIERAREP